MTKEIIESIKDSITLLKEFKSLPKEQGIYAFFVGSTNDLGKFGQPDQNIYVGISEKNISGRDTETHLKTGQTGWSTLRRSLGAVLKSKLNITAQKRDKNPKKLRPDKYKFDERGENKLTEWMEENLKIGFWSTANLMSKKKLRNEEEQVILRLKPTLDLDRRTKKYNPLAEELDSLRKICRDEVKNNEH
jgi:hypothetical protein